ncbi:hypothetical protein NYO91_01450 [Arhodomonas aquaeolei]|uniref:hypothetical protein n=1 Tax=Arhodomonas aquaeolei TaxID=2369 RepID=UPI00216A962B|nr:hypothetical protein [Arhodomonas aquaeolei]MCS4502734.1 hypothetical protein [Arhodomonas aquaeolei]
MKGSALAGAALALTLAATAGHAGPRGDYMLECAGCHLQDGSGMAPKVPDMRGIIGRMVQLPEGRAYLGRVPGAALSPLNDADLAAVMNWSLKAFAPQSTPADFEPYTAEEVARLRSDPIQKPAKARRELLKALAEAGIDGGG